MPLQHVQGKDEVITQWAMNDVEAAGLLKMDFLGLRNLTILAKVVELIEQTTGERVDPYKFPLDDEETYALLCRGDTKGVFQLESGGIRDLLQRMKPDRFRDIIATNALYRPGPLEGGMVTDYIQVKHGRQTPEYKHPVIKDILEETYGVMVYQEQVMQIVHRLGGIPLRAAYSLIKAISKKKIKEIDKTASSSSPAHSHRGFARSRRRTLRADPEVRRLRLQQEPLHRLRHRRLHHGLPQGALSGRVHGGLALQATSKVGTSRRKTRSSSIWKTASGWKSTSCRPTSTTAKRLHRRRRANPLRHGRNQRGAARRLRRDREGTQADGPFRSIFDFCERVDPSASTAPASKVWSKPAPSTGLNACRSQLMAGIGRALQSGASMLADRKRGQKGLFGGDDEEEAAGAPVRMPDVPEWDEKQKLSYEKEVLGFYLTSHPLDEHPPRSMPSARTTRSTPPHAAPHRSTRSAECSRP